MIDLSRLTEAQTKAVMAPNKIVLAISSPGSGKSTTLVARAQRLWEDFHEPILIVTFSNKAVKDLEKKIAPEYLMHIQVKTLHALCFSLVKDYWKELRVVIGGEQWPKEAKVVQKIDEINLLKELFKGRDEEDLYEKIIKLREFNLSPSAVYSCFKKGVYFGKFSQQDIELWMNYERVRLSRGLITFEDMTNLAADILPIPEVSIDVSKRFAHILIDEAQDTSEGQWKVLRPLVAQAKTTFVVGDVNQAIFGWRNADGTMLTDMGYLQNAVTFRLNESFRCGSKIAEFANKIVRDKSSQIFTRNKETPLQFKAFDERKDEIDYVLLKADAETAIIARTNAYLEQYERECIKRGISYVGSAFYRAVHIKQVAEFLHSATDDNALTFIEKAFMDSAAYTAMEKNDFKLVMKVIRNEGLEQFHELVRISNSMNGVGVTLITGHGAKGLEWPRVFVVGAHDGQMPHRLSKNEDEERNLFYVMITREAGKGMEICYIKEPSRYIKEYLG